MRIRQALAWVVLALLIWAAAIEATGGFALAIAGVRVSSRTALRPLALAVVLMAAGILGYGRRALDEEIERVIGGCRKAAALVAGAAAVAIAAIGVRWATCAASGADAYGYVSQAVLWQRGALHVDQPFVAALPWPDAGAAFAPIGYRVALTGPAIVPSYAPGLPVLMALAERIAGACGPYYVAPVFAGLCVWWCYRLGDATASRGTGAWAALLLACSPPFLFQLLMPMSDVPAAALWTGALLLSVNGAVSTASRPRRGPDFHALLAGVFAGLAILVRPNLVPLAAVVAVALLRERRDRAGPSWMRLAWFAVAVVPAVLAIAIINIRLYGSALRSGYDDLGTAYAFDHIAVNARRYAAWLAAAETPVLVVLSAAGLAAPLFVRHSLLSLRASLIFTAVVTVVCSSYFSYAVFDDWRYLRFLLPLFPPLLVGMAAFVLWSLGYLPPIVRVSIVIALAGFLAGHQLRFAFRDGIGRLTAVERRYVAVARFIEARTPQNAVFVALQHAGSIRHHAGRLSLRFDRVTVDLDTALRTLERAGWRPFILLEDWEEPQFKRQFGASSEAGRLEWRPFARLDEPGGINIYDPAQMHTAHDLISIPPPDGCDCRHY